jgi:hypothetical protein
MADPWWEKSADIQTDAQKRDLLQAAVKDLVADLLWYGRKEDEELTRAVMAEIQERGLVTTKEVVRWFEDELEEKWQERQG